MAITQGLVQYMGWSAVADVVMACVWVGPTPEDNEVFVVEFRAGDPEFILAFKKSCVALLAKAQMGGFEIALSHGDGSGVMTSVGISNRSIAPVGRVVHDDFYSITGSGIPNNVEIVFASEAVEVAIAPNLVRPHWVFVAQLPATVPVGRNMVSLRAPGWSSEAVPVEVVAGPPSVKRVLYPGPPTPHPYTISFVANPYLWAEDTTPIPDPTLGRRVDFHGSVSQGIRRLFLFEEDILRANDIDTQMRLVTVFDSSLAPTDENILMEENGWRFSARRAHLAPFMNRYFEAVDIVVLLHGHPFMTNPNAYYTWDDIELAATAFVYDGAEYRHGHFAKWPGSLHMPLYTEGPDYVPSKSFMHEFLHAASEHFNGSIVDLYEDNEPTMPLAVNKKMRAQPADPVPEIFANYNGVDYRSDPTRNGGRFDFGNVFVIGYPADWRSYHPELIDPTHVNMMDTSESVSRLDKLTYAWLSDRLWVKVLR